MDITTMLFALGLGNLTLCAALFFFEHGRKKSPSLATWSLSKQLQAAAWLLLYMGAAGVVPNALAVLVGYGALFAGVALESGALWESVQRPGWRNATLVALVLAIGAFAVSQAIDPIGLRPVVGSIVLGAFYLSGACAFALGWRNASMLRRFLAIATTLLALLVAARGVMVLTMPGGWGWISNSFLQVWSSAAFYILMLLNGFGYLLLAREQVQQELDRLAVVDAHTDVPNRRGFFMALSPWLSLARRPGVPTALVVFDLDQFKRVNDGYGHAAGDTALRAVVETCKRQLRDSDQLGRLVGVEFAILLPRTGLQEAMLVAERMRAAIEAAPVKTERALVALTASFGVTTLRAEDTTLSLFKRADDALQAAKQGGRNRVVQAAPAEAAA